MYKTIIATKSIPWYTAREGQIYYTNQLKISRSELENNNDIADTTNLENEIKSLFDNPTYKVNSGFDLTNTTDFNSISEAYNYIIENENNFGNKSANIYVIDVEKKYWFRKTNGTICKVDYPPYGILHNDKSVLPDIFPDKLDLNNEIDDIDKNYVVWLYRKQSVNIVRNKKDIAYKTDIANSRIRTWKPWFFRKIIDKNVKPRVIRISRRHHIKYGFAYYRYDADTNNYIRLKPKFENKTRF